MDSWRNDEWQEDNESYTDLQVESVLEESGIEIVSETYQHFLCFCPFHGNRSTPALLVNKTKGAFNCLNPSCDETGSLEELLRRLSGMNIFQARRFVRKAGVDTTLPFESTLALALAEPEELPLFPQSSLDRLAENMRHPSRGIDYMKSRYFTDETIDYFHVGYSDKQDMVTVPMHDTHGKPIGFIGRSTSEKKFKNSNGLPRRKTLFNLHRAKAFESVYVTEASFDGMSIFQATDTPNFVSTLGPLSPEHYQLLDKYFSTIIIMTDNDEPDFREDCRKCMKVYDTTCKGHRPGRDLGHALVAGLRRKKVLWATYSDREIFPGGHKDANAMLNNEDVLRRVLKRPMSPYEYNQNFDT